MFIGKKIIGDIKDVRDKIHGKKKIEGKVVLVKDNVLGFNDITASVIDRVSELLGDGISLQLVSAVHGENGIRINL